MFEEIILQWHHVNSFEHFCIQYTINNEWDILNIRHTHLQWHFFRRDLFSLFNNERCKPYIKTYIIQVSYIWTFLRRITFACLQTRASFENTTRAKPRRWDSSECMRLSSKSKFPKYVIECFVLMVFLDHLESSNRGYLSTPHILLRSIRNLPSNQQNECNQGNSGQIPYLRK